MIDKTNKLNIFYSDKKDGDVSEKYSDAIEAMENKMNFFKKNGIEFSKTLFLKVKYKDIVFDLDTRFVKDNKDLSLVKIEADAIITKCKDVYMYLNFGDCLPFVIYDVRQEILAFAHLGWQSVELNLHNKLVDLFVSKHNSRADDLEVYFGPSIKKESYILENPSQLKYKEWESFLYKLKDDSYQIDLNGYVVDCLIKKGLKKDNINNSEIDTVKDCNFFSHYRSIYLTKEKEGRFIFGVGMKR